MVQTSYPIFLHPFYFTARHYRILLLTMLGPSMAQACSWASREGISSLQCSHHLHVLLTRPPSFIELCGTPPVVLPPLLCHPHSWRRMSTSSPSPSSLGYPKASSGLLNCVNWSQFAGCCTSWCLRLKNVFGYRLEWCVVIPISFYAPSSASSAIIARRGVPLPKLARLRRCQAVLRWSCWNGHIVARLPVLPLRHQSHRGDDQHRGHLRTPHQEQPQYASLQWHYFCIEAPVALSSSKLVRHHPSWGAQAKAAV